jgi:hypothetical protein
MNFGKQTHTPENENKKRNESDINAFVSGISEDEPKRFCIITDVQKYKDLKAIVRYL